MAPFRIEISAAARLELELLDRETVRQLLSELGRRAIARSRFGMPSAGDEDRLDAVDLEIEACGVQATVIVDGKNSVLYLAALSRVGTERTA